MNANAASWTSLPTELKLTIISSLQTTSDAWHLAQTDRATYETCLESLFQNVHLKGYHSIHSYLNNVPSQYGSYTQHLSIRADFDKRQVSVEDVSVGVATILQHTTRLVSLRLDTKGSLDPCIIPSFASLNELRTLSWKSFAEEERAPLSERLVVSVCATVPSGLRELELERVTRSLMHADDLAFGGSIGGVASGGAGAGAGGEWVPTVNTDSTTVPPHPTLGSSLSLPSLLLIPTLEALTIKDTHLGDPLWSTIRAKCDGMKKIELGPCKYTSPEVYAEHARAVLNAASVGCQVHELAISSPSLALSIPTSSSSFASSKVEDGEKPKQVPGQERGQGQGQTQQTRPRGNSLHKLRRLTVSEHFPPMDVIDTLSSPVLDEAPIERLDFACFEMDVDDICDALHTVVRSRKHPLDLATSTSTGTGTGKGMLKQLKNVHVWVKDAEPDEELKKRLRELCGGTGVNVRVKGMSCRSFDDICEEDEDEEEGMYGHWDARIRRRAFTV